MKTYTIIAGVNGVGKTSFAGVLKECCTELGMIVCDLDGGEVVLKQIEIWTEKGVNFTQETASLEEATAKRVKELGYFVRLFYIGLDSVDESLVRIKNRVKRGGHDIPTDDVQNRFQGRWEAVAKVLPYCDVAEFYDNDNGFVKVAEYRNGELRKVGDHNPKWLCELNAHLK